jgi:hypothetical protein
MLLLSLSRAGFYFGLAFASECLVDKVSSAPAAHGSLVLGFRFSAQNLRLRRSSGGI